RQTLGRESTLLIEPGAEERFAYRCWVARRARQFQRIAQRFFRCEFVFQRALVTDENQVGMAYSTTSAPLDVARRSRRQSPDAGCESLAPPAIPVESSKVNSFGSSLTVTRWMASGMRGPSTARAKMNTVSPGAACPASVAASATLPLTAADFAVAVGAALEG